MFSKDVLSLLRDGIGKQIQGSHTWKIGNYSPFSERERVREPGSQPVFSVLGPQISVRPLQIKICTPHWRCMGPLFYSLLPVKQFLEGVLHMSSPKKAISAPWDLNCMLEQLPFPSFEPAAIASLRYLTWKTAFLVAITSARRTSELQDLLCKQPFLILCKNKVTLHTNLTFMPRDVTDISLNQLTSPCSIQGRQDLAYPGCA